MKNILIFLGVFLIYYTPIHGQFGIPFGPGGTLTDKSFKIDKGDHEANDFLGIGCCAATAHRTTTTNRHMKFRIRFDKGSTGYNSYRDQHSWNKVNMITFPIPSTNLDPKEWRQDFKIHLGWRFDSRRDALELALFYHEGGQDRLVSHYIKNGKVNPDWGGYEGVYNNVSMQIGKTALGMVIDGKALGIKRGTDYFPGTRSSYLRKHVYFGGSFSAPNDMYFRMEDIWYDNDNQPFQNDFDNASIQQWNLTEFKNGEYYDFHASNEMIGSADATIQSYPYVPNLETVFKYAIHPDQRKTFCIVHEGSTIIFRAGNKVLLKPGFHAKKGSHFLGKIEPKRKKSNRTASQSPFDEPLADTWNIKNEDDVRTLMKDLIKADKIKDHISIFPNPVNTIFQFKNKLPINISAKLFSKNGILLKEFEVSGSSIFNVNTSSYKNGYYILNVYSEGQKIMEKKILVAH